MAAPLTEYVPMHIKPLISAFVDYHVQLAMTKDSLPEFIDPIIQQNNKSRNMNQCVFHRCSDITITWMEQAIWNQVEAEGSEYPQIKWVVEF